MEANKKAQKLYDEFYDKIPSRVMHFDLHRELAVDNAILAVDMQIKTLESIQEGLQSITCKTGRTPSDLIEFFESVKKELLIIKESIVPE